MKIGKWLRRLMVLVGVLTVLVVAAWIAAHAYLKQQIVAQLSALHKGPIGIERVQLGVTKQRALGVTLSDASTGRPWISIEQVELQLPLREAVQGRTRPRAITLLRPRVELGFDEQGQLLNQLPEATSGGRLPADRIELIDAEIAIQQPGRSPLAISGIQVQLLQQEATVQVSGNVEPFLGARWTLQGELDDSGKPANSDNAGGSGRRIQWSVAATDVVLDSQTLASLPLVPRQALEGIRFNVTTPIDFTGSWQADKKLKYRLKLAPQSYQLALRGEEIEIRGGGGRIVAEDGIVSVQNLRADMFGGRVSVTGRADLSSRPWNGNISATAERIDVSKLPLNRRELNREDWPTLAGAVFGSARFDWELARQSRTIRGSGSFQVRDPQVDQIQVQPINVEFDVSQVADADAKLLDVGAVSGEARISAALVDADINRIGRLLQQLGAIDAPPKLSGRVSLESSINIPLGSLEEPLSYRAEGQMQLADVAVAGERVESLRAAWKFQDGQVRVSSIQLRLPDQGQVNGSLATDLRADEPRLDIRFDATAIPARLLAKVYPRLEGPVEGVLSGQMQASANLRNLDDVSDWRVRGRLDTEHVQWRKLEAHRLATRFELDQGTITIEQIGAERLRLGELWLTDVSTRMELDGDAFKAEQTRARWNDTQLNGRFEVALAEPYAYSVDISADGVTAGGVAAITELPALREQLDDIRVPGGLKIDGSLPIDGMLDVTANVRGNVSPFSLEVAGTLKSQQLTLELLQLPLELQQLKSEDWSATQLEATWKFGSRKFELEDLRFDALGGQFRFAGTLPWDADESEQVTGEFNGIDAQLLAGRVPGELPFDLRGKLEGSFTVTEFLDLEKIAAELRFKGLDASAREWPVSGLSGKLAYRNGELDVEARGKLMDAAVRFKGNARLGTHGLDDASVAGRLEWSDARILDITRKLGLPAQRQRLRGAVTAALDVTAAGPTWTPQGSGRLVFRDLRWDAATISKAVECNVSVDDGILRVSDLSARIAGGQVRANLSLNLQRSGTGTFVVRADRLALDRLAYPWRRSLPKVHGRVSLLVRGRLGGVWRGTGQVTVDGGAFADVPFELQRALFDWRFAPHNGNAETSIRFTSARLASGRLSGRLRAKWSGRLDMEGSVQLKRARMRQLARVSSQIRNSLSGRLDAKLNFKGNDIDSLESVSGDFWGRLVQSQALALPVLDSLVSSLGIGSPTSKTFSETEVQGDFRRGIIRVERMTMESSETSLFVEGTVTTKGRLDLDVTADTPQIAAVGLVLGVLRPLDFLRRRLIFLHVSGSIRAPSVQPRTAEFIEQEIMLFFLPLSTPRTIGP